MDPLAKQLATLSAPLLRLPKLVRYGLAAGLAVLVLVGVALSSANVGDHFQYAFTNLGPEDSTEVAEHLKSAGIPFRLEAGGAAVAVPGDKVYDARLLLASVGLPRGGGVGFELFDRGDIGTSEFTQRVNLRRATEGELARTIGHLAEVRSARVHLTFEEKSLFRDDDHKASAAVVVNLQPGRTLDERSVTGIRHLVASSVPALSPDAVTLVDGRGRSLTSNEGAGPQSLDLEHSLEQRIVALLETVVGSGAVVAKVSVTQDDAEVTTNSEIYDPDSAALRSEHKAAQSNNQSSGAPSGIAGAAANQPAVAQPATPQSVSNGSSTNEDQLRNYELSKTVTRTVKRSPRLVRVSAAILVDGTGGKPRPAEEIARLGELAKRAIGFDAARGDVVEITSEVFAHSAEDAVPAAPAATALQTQLDKWKWYGAAGGALLLAALVFGLTRRRRATDALVLRPGATVAELDGSAPAVPVPAPPAPPVVLLDPAIALRNRALELAQSNPTRAAHLLRAWIASDTDGQGVNHG